MKSKYLFPKEFRTNLAMKSELPSDMVRHFIKDYYIDKHTFSAKTRVCKMEEDKELKDWYKVTHLTLYNRFDMY